MSLLLAPALPSSDLALATTVHLALSALRHHRHATGGRRGALATASIALSVSPWVLPSAAGLSLGLTMHAAWFWTCERWSRSGRPRDDSRSETFAPVPVLAVFEESPDVRTFRLRRPVGFAFEAGQFLPVRVSVDGRDHVRCYSISSSPATRAHLDISVKRQGLVSGTLHATVQPGTPLSVRAPGGSFTYPTGDDRPLLLLAGGIGITPLLSMLRHAVEIEPWRRVTLLYSAPTEDALAFRADIRTIASRHPQVTVRFAVTRHPGGPDAYAGRIDETLLRTTLPDVTRAIAMICGPQPMIDGLRQLLSSLGVPDAQVRFERFEMAVAATGGWQAGGARRLPADQASSHTVRWARSGSTMRATHGERLLDAAESSGIAIDSLCRSGVCGTCRTRVLSGDVACESTLLTAADRERGHVLACIAEVRSDCVVDV